MKRVPTTTRGIDVKRRLTIECPKHGTASALPILDNRHKN